MSSHWVRWHDRYANAADSVNDRRLTVISAIERALTEAPSGPITLLSLCAGDATDVSTASTDHARRDDVRGAVVELDTDLAQRAATNIATAGVGLEVRVADAGTTDTFADLAPVDVLLLVGIFGNITKADIRRTVLAVPALCRTGATVIWTRHTRDPDVTPAIRDWFGEAGCTELAFTSPGPNDWSVGVARVGAVVGPPPGRLFTFLPTG